MMQGTQRINGKVINIVGVEEFDNVAIFLKAGVAITLPISDKSSIYFKYMYGKSLGLKNDTNSGNSELKIGTNTAGLGLSLGL